MFPNIEQNLKKMFNFSNRFDLNWKNVENKTTVPKAEYEVCLRLFCNLYSSIPVCFAPFPTDVSQWFPHSHQYDHSNDQFCTFCHLCFIYLFIFVRFQVFDLSLLLSPLLMSQWCTAQHCHLQKTAFLSRTSATTISRRPAASDACLSLTSRARASDCAGPMAPGQEPLPGAQVRTKGIKNRTSFNAVLFR